MFCFGNNALRLFRRRNSGVCGRNYHGLLLLCVWIRAARYSFEFLSLMCCYYQYVIIVIKFRVFYAKVVLKLWWLYELLFHNKQLSFFINMRGNNVTLIKVLFFDLIWYLFPCRVVLEIWYLRFFVLLAKLRYFFWGIFKTVVFTFEFHNWYYITTIFVYY